MAELTREKEKENASKIENMLPEIPRSTCASNKKLSKSKRSSPDKMKPEESDSVPKKQEKGESVGRWKKRRDTVGEVVRPE